MNKTLLAIAVLAVFILFLIVPPTPIKDSSTPTVETDEREESHGEEARDDLTIYIHLDFEEGTGIDWTRSGGGHEVTQNGGVFSYVTSTPSAFAGNFCMKNWVPASLAVRRAKGGRISEIEYLTELYVGGAVYVPTGFVPEPFWNQFASLADPYRGRGGAPPATGDRYADLGFKIVGGELVVDLSDRINVGHAYHHLYYTGAVATGEWHTWILYLKIASAPNGELKFWWDNTVEASPDFTDTGNYNLLTDPPGTYLNAGLYVGNLDALERWLGHDEIRVASTFAEASPIQVPPDDEEDPIDPEPAQYYDVTLLSSTGGSTIPSASSHHLLVGQLFKASAYSSADYIFTKWLLNGADFVTSTNVTIEGVEGLLYTLQPVFTTSLGASKDPPPLRPPPLLPKPAQVIGDSTLFGSLLEQLTQNQPMSLTKVLKILTKTRVNI